MTIEWNSVLDEVLGDDSGVTGMRIRNVKDESTREIPAAGRVHCHRPQAQYARFSQGSWR